MKNELVQLGVTNPELRPHIRQVLAAMGHSKTASSLLDSVKKYADGFVLTKHSVDTTGIVLTGDLHLPMEVLAALPTEQAREIVPKIPKTVLPDVLKNLPPATMSQWIDSGIVEVTEEVVSAIGPRNWSDKELAPLPAEVLIQILSSYKSFKGTVSFEQDWPWEIIDAWGYDDKVESLAVAKALTPGSLTFYIDEFSGEFDYTYTANGEIVVNYQYPPVYGDDVTVLPAATKLRWPEDVSFTVDSSIYDEVIEGLKSSKAKFEEDVSSLAGQNAIGLKFPWPKSMVGVTLRSFATEWPGGVKFTLPLKGLSRETLLDMISDVE